MSAALATQGYECANSGAALATQGYECLAGGELVTRRDAIVVARNFDPVLAARSTDAIVVAGNVT